MKNWLHNLTESTVQHVKRTSVDDSQSFGKIIELIFSIPDNENSKHCQVYTVCCHSVCQILAEWGQHQNIQITWSPSRVFQSEIRPVTVLVISENMSDAPHVSTVYISFTAYYETQNSPITTHTAQYLVKVCLWDTQRCRPNLLSEEKLLV